jgi:hypothetical protein
MKRGYFILAVILTIPVLLIMFLFIMGMLGYQFNKKYFSYDRQECISTNNSDIEGCVFWMRNSHLIKIQDWPEKFQKYEDENYCKKEYGHDKNNAAVENFRNSLDRYSDPKCSYNAFKDKMRKENWGYLTSKKKEGFYEYCVKQNCPEQPLFK